jgi:hypothetical protein
VVKRRYRSLRVSNWRDVSSELGSESAIAPYMGLFSLSLYCAYLLGSIVVLFVPFSGENFEDFIRQRNRRRTRAGGVMRRNHELLVEHQLPVFISV